MTDGKVRYEELLRIGTIWTAAMLTCWHGS